MFNEKLYNVSTPAKLYNEFWAVRSSRERDEIVAERAELLLALGRPVVYSRRAGGSTAFARLASMYLTLYAIEHPERAEECRSLEPVKGKACLAFASWGEVECAVGARNAVVEGNRRPSTVEVEPAQAVEPVQAVEVEAEVEPAQAVEVEVVAPKAVEAVEAKAERKPLGRGEKGRVRRLLYDFTASKSYALGYVLPAYEDLVETARKNLDACAAYYIKAHKAIEAGDSTWGTSTMCFGNKVCRVDKYGRIRVNADGKVFDYGYADEF